MHQVHLVPVEGRRLVWLEFSKLVITVVRGLIDVGRILLVLVHDLRLIWQVLLLHKVLVVKVWINLVLELLRHHKVLILLKIDSQHPVLRSLLEDVAETGS